MVNLPWGMATITNGQKCTVCYSHGKTYSFGALAVAAGLAQYKPGFWRFIRQEIVRHYASEHPKYRITRLREGPK